MTTQIKSGVIAANSITATQIAANSITASAIASDAIVVADIANNSITSAKIAANAVDSAELVSGSIDTVHIADSQVTNAKLANSSVTINSNSLSLGGTLTLDTDDIGEGSTNLYYTDARVQAVSINNLSEDTTPQLGGDLGANGNLITFGDSSGATDDRLKFGASGDLQIYHDGSNSYVRDNGTGNLNIQGNNLILEDPNGVNFLGGNGTTGAVTVYYSGAAKLATTSTGIDVTGNIVVSGTVDGRDIATDGTKLDGIEANATADQTQSDINALAITQVGTISSGTWQGTAIASAYLDSDTAHLSGAQTFSGAKTFSSDITLNSSELVHNNTTFGTFDWRAYQGDTGELTWTVTGTSGAEMTLTSDGSNYANASLSVGGASVITTTNTKTLTNKTITSPVINTGVSGTAILDEDTMSSNSATKLATQQSIKAYVDAQVAGVVDSAPAALDTLNELAAALGDDANFSTTTSTALGNRLRVDTAAQGLTGTQQANAITNLGITATKAELNVLDGITATTAELNYTDGVTSNIQTQLDTKLASSSYTAADVLTKIKTVDGAGSGLDADLLDGLSSASFLRADAADTAASTITFNGINFTNTTGSSTTDLSKHIALYGTTYGFSITANNLNLVANGTNTLSSTSSALTSKVNHDFSAGIDVTGNITVTGTVDGRDLATDGTKLDGIESGATADQTAAEILTAIKTVDGAGSGLDADLLDGISSASFLRSDAADTLDIGRGGVYIENNSGDNGSGAGITLRTSSNPSSGDPASVGNMFAIRSSGQALRFAVGQSITSTGDNDFTTNDITANGNITVTGTVDGRDIASDGSKLDGIESGATADQSASEILTLIKTVDGAGSGLDADLLDGLSSASFLRSDASDTMSGQLIVAGNIISDQGSGGGSYLKLNTDDAVYARLENAYSSNDVLELCSMGSIQFSIDTNNNSTGKDFIWKHNGSGSGGTTLATLFGDSGDFQLNTGDLYLGDKIIHNGDTNTYTQFNGADQWRVVTGGTARLSIVSGTTTVAGNFSVNGGTIKLDGNYPTGTENVALGDTALDSVSTGARNTAIGTNAGTAISSGTDNTAVGMNTLASVTTGTSNTAVGRNALYTNTASNNTGLGYYALFANTTGVQNTAVGSGAADTTTTANNVTAFGYAAAGLGTQANQVTALGSQSLYYNTGVDNTGVGYAALFANTSGNYCTAVGSQALDANTTGVRNTALGYSALTDNVSGSYNTAVGMSALENNTASSNTAIGTNSSVNITTGANNTSVGYQSLDTCSSGSDNVAVGHLAADATTSGSRNVFIGKQAGYDATDATNNVFIGYQTRNDNAGTSNQVVIGHQARSQGSGKFTVGTSTTTYSHLTIGGTSWSGSSDERLKKEITDSTAGLSFINDLRPVTFKWKTKGEVDSSLPHYIEGSSTPVIGDSDTNSLTKHGFIAQEVKAVLDNHPEVKDGADIWETNRDEIQNFAPTALIPMLVKSIQELSAKCDSLQSEINILKGE